MGIEADLRKPLGAVTAPQNFNIEEKKCDQDFIFRSVSRRKMKASAIENDKRMNTQPDSFNKTIPNTVKMSKDSNSNRKMQVVIKNNYIKQSPFLEDSKGSGSKFDKFKMYNRTMKKASFNPLMKMNKVSPAQVKNPSPVRTFGDPLIDDEPEL